MTTKIEWATSTWNPIVGCSKASEGCANCYAEKMAARLAHMGNRSYQDVIGGDKDNWFRSWNGKLALQESQIEKPLKWKKPQMVFVCSMSDMFHENSHKEWCRDIFHIMDQARQHTYMLLTKRPLNMLNFIETDRIDMVVDYPHVWLGVTAENQKRADERIPILLQIPAAVRFVSFEPLLSRIDTPFFTGHFDRHGNYRSGGGINWAIAGGESGPGARPTHPDWVRGLRSECRVAGVPFLFKQWGAWEPSETRPEIDTCYHRVSDGSVAAYPPRAKHHWWGGAYGDGKPLSVYVGKHKAGRLIDGRTWDGFPEAR